jgi:hypothetical protein
MSSLKLTLAMVLGSALLYLSISAIDEWMSLSATFEFAPGISWMYLPAGVRLMCTLLFGGAGAIGIWIASWILCTFYFFPDDPLRAVGGSIASALAPYLVYKAAQKLYGLHASLTNLTTKRLFLLAVCYALANPVLHHAWLFLTGGPTGKGLFVMIIGDFTGTLVMLYAIKCALSCMPKH